MYIRRNVYKNRDKIGKMQKEENKEKIGKR